MPLRPGTYSMAPGSGGDYRRVATATSPAASKGSYTVTVDSGRSLPDPFFGSDSGGKGPVVYADRDFGGGSQTLEAGDYDLQRNGGVGDDVISSAKVPAGWTVTLYADGSCKGDFVTLTADTPYVGDALNDRTSSIRVTGPR